MRSWVVFAALAGLLIAGCPGGPRPVPTGRFSGPEAELESFIERHVARVAPLSRRMNLAYWRAATTGDRAAFEEVAELELRIRRIHASPDDFLFLLRTLESGKVRDPLLARQLDLLLTHFEEHQIDEELLQDMVRLASRLEKKFSDFHPAVDGRELSDNDIYDILKSEIDPGLRKAAWEGYKARGAVVRDDLLALVRMRNRAARSLGYTDYYDMRLRMDEQDPERIRSLFDELARQTDEPFSKLMREIKAQLAGRFGIEPGEIRPWHFEDPFFQRAPVVGRLDLDPLFADRDPRQVVFSFFSRIGLDPSGILRRSDLDERPGKQPHAFCLDVDRAGDVRILASLRRGESWTAALLHEMGHAVYDAHIARDLPWLLRVPAHVSVTEAVAGLFGSQTRNPAWLVDVLGVSRQRLKTREAEIREGLRRSVLVFVRFCLVMTHFERELYRDPEQDLNRLWWELAKRYQLVDPPEGRDAPDWASKLHLVVAPVYYHNYLLGRLMASQLLYHLPKSEGKRSGGSMLYEESGRFLKESFFAPGASLRWDDLLRKAFGEGLDPKYFIEQFSLSPGD